MDMKSKNLNWFLELKIFIKSQVWLCVAAAAAKSLQSCPTLCDPIDSSPPGSPVPGILQARTLEWVAISFSNAWMWKVKMKSRSRVRLFATPWTAAYQAPPFMGFSRQEYWSGVPLPSPDVYVKELKTGSSGPWLRHRRLLNSPPPLQQQHKPLKETQEWAEPELHIGQAREYSHWRGSWHTLKPRRTKKVAGQLQGFETQPRAWEVGRQGSSPICGHMVNTGRRCYCI